MPEPTDRSAPLALLHDVAALRGTAASTPGVTIPALFEQHAQAAPDAIAVASDTGALTYQELSAEAARLARALARRRIGAGSVVGVVIPRSPELLVAMLGVLMAGAAYLPVDPDYPPQRLAFMLRDAAPRLVLTSSGPATQPDASQLGLCPWVPLNELLAGDQQPVAALAGHPDMLAYVIYTSGSTGVPKGIGTTHRDVVGLALDHRYGDGSQARVLAHAPLAFDASIYELWVPLLNGGQVVIAPEGDLTPGKLARLVAGYRLTAVFLTPALFNLLVEDDPRCLAGLAQVWVGGERILPHAVRRAVAACPGTVIVNGYGPTETTVFATCHLVDPAEEIGDDVPIGRPMDFMRGYVLDDRLRPVPAQRPGELYLAGIGLARGYLGRPGQTAERFVASPYGPPGEVMYRTGDIVTVAEDGELMYRGRADEQVKVRGFRIEPGEIEAALLTHPAVANAVVVARQDRGDGEGKQLVGYVTLAHPDGGGDEPGPSSAELRAFVARRLPEFMVPAVIVTLDRLPLTPNGKLDRAALPPPAFTGTAYRPPRSAAEQVLASVFAEVLGRELLGIDDDFFAFGGDSIQSIQAVTRARARGLLISSRQIFACRTIAELARVATDASREGARDAAAARAEPGDGVGWMPLLPVARWIRELGPGFERLLQAAVLELPEGIDRAGLTATVAAVVARHDILRARLAAGGVIVDSPGQVDVAPLIRRIDYDGTWSGQEWRSLLVAELNGAAERMDPSAGVVAQFVWFAPRSGPGRLLLTLHHLAVDSVTWRILMPDFAAAWAQVRAEQTPSIPPVPTSVRSWAHALAAEAVAPERAAELTRWLSILEGPDPVLGARRLDSSIDVMGTVSKVRVRLPEQVTEALLTTVPTAFHGGVNDGLLAGLALAVARWRRHRGVTELSTLLRLEGHGREEELVPGADLSRTAGWFTSVFPVRLDIAGVDLDEAFAGGPAAGAAVKAVKEQLLAVPGRGMGYGLLRYLNEETAAVLRQYPLGQIGFNYLGRFSAAEMPQSLRGLGWTLTDDLAELEELAELDAGHSPVMPAQAEVDINATVTGTAAGLQLSATFGAPAGVLPAPELAELAELWCAALEGLARHAGQPGAGGLTPSDTPLVAVGQDELDAFQARYPALSDVWPLTAVQAGMLHHAALDAGAYQVQLVIALDGEVDAGRLRAAGQAMLDRHAALRTGYLPSASGDLVALVVDDAALPWQEVTVPGDQALEHFLAADRAEPFDVAVPPLLRMSLVRTGPARAVTVLTAHHVLFDGWSEPILARDLLRLYVGDTALPDPARFADFLGWLAGQDTGRSARMHAAALAGVAGPTLIAAAEAAPDTAGHGEVEVALTAAEADALADLAAGLGGTLNVLVQAAWAMTLAGLTGRTDVVFGATVSGRPPTLDGAEAAVGLFINTLPVRVKCAPWRTLAAVVAGLQAAQADLLEHHHCGLLDIHKATGQHMLFDTIVAFQSFPSDSAAIADAGAAAGLTVTAVRPIGASHYPVALYADHEPRLRLRLQYRCGALDEATIGRAAAGLGHVLRSFLADPGHLVGEVVLRGFTARTDAVPVDGAAPDPVLRLLGPFLTTPEPGTEGDLYVAEGHGGVLPGHPGLTATRFVADPLGPPGGRMYRTGARIRWVPGGCLEHTDGTAPRGRALPGPGPGPAAGAPRPGGDRAELLRRLFAEVLGHAEVEVHDDFFVLGGDSLRATRLIGRIRAELGQQVSIRSLFQHRTVAELDARWDDIATAVTGPRLRPVAAKPVTDAR